MAHHLFAITRRYLLSSSLSCCLIFHQPCTQTSHQIARVRPCCSLTFAETVRAASMQRNGMLTQGIQLSSGRERCLRVETSLRRLTASLGLTTLVRIIHPPHNHPCTHPRNPLPRNLLTSSQAPLSRQHHQFDHCQHSRITRRSARTATTPTAHSTAAVTLRNVPRRRSASCHL